MFHIILPYRKVCNLYAHIIYNKQIQLYMCIT